MALPHTNGKLSAETVLAALRAYEEDETREHTVMPGMVYISQPTETGMLYSLAELTAISRVCRDHGIPLYADGARLAYALACPENDVALADLARLCDVFYIGGTKCGALFGEAVVIPQHGYIPHFFSIIKQHGALLAKGRICALQFDALFTDGLYDQIGQTAIRHAARLQDALEEAGIPLMFRSPTNQIFAVLEDEMKKTLDQYVDTSFWEKPDSSHTTVRIATSWATSQEDVDALIDLLTRFRL
jgi:threonine aldolase